MLKMLTTLSLGNISARLSNSDLQQFLSASSDIKSISSVPELWAAKLATEFDILPQDYQEQPSELYQQLMLEPPGYEDRHDIVSRGDMAAIKYLETLGIYVDDCVNRAVENGHVKILQHLESLEFPLGLLVINPNLAAENGHLEMVQYLVSIGIPPTEEGASRAVINGHFETVKYLVSIGILPSKLSVDNVAGYKQMEMMKCLVSIGIHPTQESANNAATFGQLEMVQYLVDELGIRPTEEGANGAAALGKLEMVQYLVDELGIRHTQHGANQAATFGKLEMVQYLVDELGIRPTQEGANGAARSRDHAMISYLSSLKPCILPNRKYASDAVNEGHLWMVPYMLLSSE